MNLSLSKTQVQAPVFSASLEHSLHLLILSHEELLAEIEQEIQDNPLLESEPATDFEQTVEWKQLKALSTPASSQISETSLEDSEDEPFSMASMLTLEDHLLQQLFWEISDPQGRKIGEFIIGNLDVDGFLEMSCEEIAENLSITNISLIREVLTTIQNFDPIGIATSNIRECLIAQLNMRPSLYKDLAIRIINESWDDLGHKRYAGLAKKLNLSQEEIMKAAHLISSLEPRPARNFKPQELTVYTQPDLFVRKDENGQYRIETNKGNLPILRINQTYRNMLNRPHISPEEKKFIHEKLNNALTFIKNIQQRGTTLTAITKYIIDHQKNFFETNEASLSPMTLKEVASALERAESTISRAINNKYIDTPRGLFPLKFFFTNSVGTQNHEDISSYTIKEEIAQLIKDEDKQHPLSDQDILDHFHSKGITVARRTIAKYRQMMDIPSSHQRK